MYDKIQFRQLLVEISEIAAVNGNKITIDEVNNFFEDAKLEDEQLEMVYAYLESQKITVEGHKPTENNEFIQAEPKDEIDNEAPKEQEELEKLDKSEQAFVDMYLEELNSIQKLTDTQLLELCNAVSNGDEIAKTRLIEGYLLNVVDIAKEYAGKGVLVSDMIQEGNVGLMLAVDKIAQGEKNDYLEILKQGVAEIIESAIFEADILKSAKSNLVSKVNYLHGDSQSLNEDLERKATVAELAKYMDMTEDEVWDMIKLSDYEIEVSENDRKDKE